MGSMDFVSRRRGQVNDFLPRTRTAPFEIDDSYPQGRIRSALIPMLLYCQDEVGHISEELMLECAKRLGLSRCR